MKLKPFAFSHSRLRAFETCPRRHLEVDLLKNFSEGPSPERDYGGDLHKALENRCKDGVVMEKRFTGYEDVAQAIDALPGEKMFEHKIAINRDMKETTYFAKDVWYRVVLDVLTVAGPLAGLIDYKTGKRKDDTEQLKLNATAIFIAFPDVQKIDARLWWITTPGRPFTRTTIERKDMRDIWSDFLPRVRNYERCHGALEFRPKPSGLCRNHCPVTTCPSNGANE